MTAFAMPARTAPRDVDAPHGQTQPRARMTVAAFALGLGVLAMLLLFVPATLNGLDGRSMLQVTQSMVERGDVTTTPGYGVPGLHRHYYSKYGPGQSVAAIPLYLAGRALAPLVPSYYRPELPSMLAALLPALATALTAVLLVLAAVELGAPPRGALALGLVYALATPAAVYAMEWFSEPLTACAVLASLYLLLRDRLRPTTWRPLLAGVALSFAVATRLEAILLAPPLLLYALLPTERRVARAAALALPLAVTLAGLGAYNAVRFGSPLETGYSKGDIYAQRDTHPVHSLASLAEGVYGLLASPGKGLLAYAPAVVLAPLGAVLLWARRRAETALLLALLLIDLLAHANVLIRWVGGWSWGPRFLLPVLPLALLLLAPLLGNVGRWGSGTRRLLTVLAVLGVVVQAPGLVLDEPHIYIYSLQPHYCHAPGQCRMGDLERMESDYINRPALSPIVGSWRMLWTPGTWTPPRDVSPALVARKGVTTAPHTWWRLLAQQGVPAWRLVAGCLALAAAAVALLLAALRLTTGGTSRPSLRSLRSLR